MTRPVANDNHRRDALVFVAWWLALLSLCLVAISALPLIASSLPDAGR